MPVYKDTERKTWIAKFSYITRSGQRKFVTKRGFTRKRDAVQYERDFLAQQKTPMGMTFAEFIEVYCRDIAPKVKPDTLETKTHVIETKLLPYFGQKRMCDIKESDVLNWDDYMARRKNSETGEPYSASYLRTIHSQLSAIFNHAVRYYNLDKNPARSCPHVENKDQKLKYWTKDQYQEFAEYMMGDPIAYYCFQILFWCGLQEGEVFALTANDFDFQKNTISVSKTYRRLKNKDSVSEIRSIRRIRKVEMPAFLATEIKEYISTLHELKPKDRIFSQLSKRHLLHRLDQASIEFEFPEICVQDLRHSHAILMLSMGYDPINVAKRMGVKPEEIFKKYSDFLTDIDKKIPANITFQSNNSQTTKITVKEDSPPPKDDSTLKDDKPADLKQPGMVSPRSSPNRVCDGQGRWRSKTIGVRVSPEENDTINVLAELSGMSKQDYCISRLLQHDVVVIGNPRVHKALKSQIEAITAELQRLQNVTEITPDTLKILEQVSKIYDNLK